jgi:hypothetical protein
MMSIALETQAHTQAIRAPVPEVAAYLQEVLGQKLTALTLAIGDPKAVGRWARGERSPHPDVEQRLRATYQITTLLMQAGESPEIVRAWFMGMNPHLNDEAPALMMPQAPTLVLQAARAFLL